MNFSKLTFFLFILSINSSDAICKTPDSTFNVVGDSSQTCSDACTACGGTDNTAANIGNMDSASEITDLTNSICTLNSGSYTPRATSSVDSSYRHYPSIAKNNNICIYPDNSYTAGSSPNVYNVCSCSVTTNCNTNCDCSSINKVGTTPSPPTNAPTNDPTNAPTNAATTSTSSQNDDSSDLSDAKIGAIAAGSGLFLVSAIGGAVYYFSSSSTATATATESISSTVDNGESDKKQTIIDLSDTKTPGV